MLRMALQNSWYVSHNQLWSVSSNSCKSLCHVIHPTSHVIHPTSHVIIAPLMISCDQSAVIHVISQQVVVVRCSGREKSSCSGRECTQYIVLNAELLQLFISLTGC